MDWTPRRASIIAACALIAMAVIAPFAAFGIFPDGAAGLTMTVVGILDILVGVALWRALAPRHASLAALAAALRVGYSAVLVVAAASLSAGDDDAWNSTWDAGLLIFGAHLVVVALILLRDRGFALITGVLVAIAGLGYLIDSTAALLVPGLVLGVGTVAFVGELVLIVWLFIRGGRTVTERPLAASAA